MQSNEVYYAQQAACDQKYSKKSNTVKYYYYLKYLSYLKVTFILVMAKLHFQHPFSA